MSNLNENPIIEPEQIMTRRDFLKASAMLGGSVALASQLNLAWDLLAQNEAEAAKIVEYPYAKPENIIYSVCQQCNTNCGIKVKLVDGVVAKIDGSPYNPFTLNPHLPYKTALKDAATVDGAICPKGQASIQTTYDPYRIVKVLKRAGKRGENKWISVPFDQAVTEIVEGGKLFEKVPGEESRAVTGLRELYALKDPKVAAAMDAEVKKIWAEKDAEKKKGLIAGFKTTFAANLKDLIDPDHPDLGPKNNQMCFMWGRLKGGRSDFINRFARDGFGSTNTHGHTTVCQGSLYFSGKAMSEQFSAGSFTGGEKFYWQADVENSEFVIFVGASPFEGNYGPSNRVPRITEGLVSGRLKYVVIDPRLSKVASKAWKWMPNKPGTEAAIAMALIRYLIDNKKYDEKFLRAANKAGAAAVGEPSWTNATWLIKLDASGAPTVFVRASEVGLATKDKGKDKDGKEIDVWKVGAAEFTVDPLVVYDGKALVAFDPNDDKQAVTGELVVDSGVAGSALKVKTSFMVIKESAEAKTFEQYAEEAGLSARDLEEVAFEFAKHGKKAVADIHRGVSQHTNGFYNVLAWNTLNTLKGNYDWKGGFVRVSTYDAVGSKAGGPYDLAKLTPNKQYPFGISIIRHDVKYDETTMFAGYPAKRNWYPLASDIYQELIPSMGDAYPYPVKALFIYMGSPIYSLPAGNTNIDILSDPNKIPLVIANDIVIGETSMYADYIFPDLTNLERWEFAGSHPNMTVKQQPVRQPTIAPLIETVKVYGREQPISLESLILGIAEKLNLPNFGPNGFGEGKSLTHMDDLYIKMVANLGFGEKSDGTDAVPDADDEEMRLFLEARKHLSKSVFDVERWKSIAGDAHWRKTVFVLNRGGRFQDYAKIYDGEKVANKYGKLINLFQEKTAKLKHAITGKAITAYPTYIPPYLDIQGKPLTEEDEKAGFDLKMITYREISMTKSRTATNYWLLALYPENAVLMNAVDAKKRGFVSGDKVRITSATNPNGEYDLKNGQKVPVVGKVKVMQGIRPGVIAFSLGHGHWAYGGVDVSIDGTAVKGDSRRTRGFHANATMRIDPYLKNTTLVDSVGGSVVFYDSLVKVTKA
ncbi:MAG: molybdopterin-dependent oxidoreductase [Chloroflexi bacterium]|nr:molybdopterin-dependent oxidoreductase [Chloroflexota bacterium]